VAIHIPLERLLLETDAPFLAPVPKRGKRNEPAFIVHTAEKIARLRHVDFQMIADQTTENARKLFSLPAL
jgi:TatD DNase family protein